MILFRSRKILLICSLLIFSLAISGCFRALSKKNHQVQNYKNKATNKVVTHHRVKPGETLYSIAFQYGRDVRDVARWNRVKRPYTIYPKQKLRVIAIASDGRQKFQKQTKKIRSFDKRSKRLTIATYKARPVVNVKIKWRWPTRGKVISTFSYRDPGRRGIDIAGKKGQPVLAAAEGRVVYRGSGLRGYGNLIILKHNDTFFSAYAHTENMVVKEKQKVKFGQKLADMGNTSTEKTKLHFEIRRNGKPVNPLRYLPKRR